MRRGFLIFQRDGDLARVAAGGGDNDFAGRLFADALEFVAPLDQHQSIGGEQLIEAEGFELALAFEAIDIEVKELDRLAVAACRRTHGAA